MLHAHCRNRPGVTRAEECRFSNSLRRTSLGGMWLTSAQSRMLGRRSIGATDGQRRVDRRASWTAQVCAAQRAAETMLGPRRRRLDDPHSGHYVHHPALKLALLHPLAARAFITLLARSMPGVHDFVVLRVRYFDKVIDQAFTDGIDQIVLLGAGFDTTSLRHQHAGATFFEVDVPSTQHDKRRTTDALVLGAQRRVNWVPCDFEKDVLSERLTASGFDPARRCVIAWIGVTMFLTRDAITATLADLATVCAPGSPLVLDYIDAAVVSGHTTSPSAQRVAKTVASSGEPYRTGFTTNDINAVLAHHGFTPHDHAATTTLQQRFSPTRVALPPGHDWLTILTAHRARNADASTTDRPRV